MSSPNDNVLLKNGNDLPFSMRSKDQSALQDGSLQVIRHLSTPYPVDYGAGGCYQAVIKSSTVAAGLASGSPILAFRNPSTLFNALIRKVRLNAWTLGAGFTAGIANFELYLAKSFTVQDTGGAALTLTAPEAKLATTMGTVASLIRYGTTAGLTAGTRTLNANPVGSINVSAPTTTYTRFFNDVDGRIVDKSGAEHPLLIAQNEGFVIQATVPATGTWGWTANIEWDEVPIVNFGG